MCLKTANSYESEITTLHGIVAGMREALELTPNQIQHHGSDCPKQKCDTNVCPTCVRCKIDKALSSSASIAKEHDAEVAARSYKLLASEVRSGRRFPSSGTVEGIAAWLDDIDLTT